jgi:hypothetical protein
MPWRSTPLVAVLLVPISLLICSAALRAQQPGPRLAEASLPDSPQPQIPSSSPTPRPNPCPPASSTSPAPSLNSAAVGPTAGGAVGAGSTPAASAVGPTAAGAGGPCAKRRSNWYERFVDGPHDQPLTPRDKAWLAVRNLVDPFNLITIGGEAGFSVGLDSHSPYGPGMPGYARYVGVSVAEDMTGEFFGTFLIPSVAHQDPHYHRMEHARIPRRVGHALLQVAWTQGDNGKGMPNYANLIGFACDDAIANLYVPGRKTDGSATAARYATALASAPIDNFVNEFLPDVARHIHVQIVILQRIINQVADRETMNASNSP